MENIFSAVDNSSNLKIKGTYTIEEFKNMMGCDKIGIKPNPYTGKIFFTYSKKNADGSKLNLVGKVSTKGKGDTKNVHLDYVENGVKKSRDVSFNNITKPVISELDELDRDGNPTYMLHEEAASVEDIMSL